MAVKKAVNLNECKMPSPNLKTAGSKEVTLDLIDYPASTREIKTRNHETFLFYLLPPFFVEPSQLLLAELHPLVPSVFKSGCVGTKVGNQV